MSVRRVRNKTSPGPGLGSGRSSNSTMPGPRKTTVGFSMAHDHSGRTLRTVSASASSRLPVLPAPRLQIVLLHPEIPNNTGAIGRTAAATGCRLHVVHPIGFDMGESARRRAGLDYWHLVDCWEHESWDAFVASQGLAREDSRIWLYST